MHTKLINPATDGHVVFRNHGAVDRLIAYLLHERRERSEEEGIFFNQYSDNIKPEEVRNALNNNVKGLRKNEEKFFTIVVSPSEAELLHIGNSDQKLRTFVRQIMDDYARNFNLKDGRKLKGEDLLWFAVIHTDRKVKNTDLKTEEGYLSEKEKRGIQDLQAKGDPRSLEATEKIKKAAEKRNMNRLDGEVFHAGDKKPGLNKHIHIVVSRKDISMQYSLNPRGRKARFDMRKWQENNGRRFQELFGYTQETIREGFYFSKQDKTYFEGKIRETVHQINEKYLKEEKLDEKEFQRIGAGYNYSRAFFINLGKMKSRYMQGDYFVDPYHFVARGRDIRPDEYVRQDRRKGADYSPEMQRQEWSRSLSAGGVKLQEILSAFKQYRPFSYVRDPMLFEGELRRRKRFGKEEGKQEEKEQ